MAETVLMGSFGENLRREREMRGVTLEEISAATKISVRFLKSIEGEDFSKLPGGLFNRSFIRAYARYLGLDEDSVLAEYQLAAKTKGEIDLTRFSLPAPRSDRRRSSRHSWIGVAVAVVLLLAGFGLWQHSRGSTKGALPPKTPQFSSPDKLPRHEAAPVASAKGASPSATPASELVPTASAGSSNKQPVITTSPQPQAAATKPAEPSPEAKTPAKPDYGNGLVLQIATTERSWVAIDADGKTVMQGIMNPNEVKTLKAKESFDVLTGNAQGVVLTLNGRTLKPLGREGEVKSIHLTRDSLRTPTSP